MRSHSTHPTAREREAPLVIVLEPRPGQPASAAPPVRIFLGTERAQWRAERIFVWSIEKVRDPSRRYEIHLMRDLAGYNRLGWTTGFTNHRFAVPHYAGASGRAIYNDVDQIYLADPAELFDLELGGHGYLAIAERETSVMLLDCQRMAGVWRLEDAQHRSKRALIRRALRDPGLYGPLDGRWNIRDEDEYRPDQPGCYHFTTLHTQPWHPFPERFSYHPHPHGELWYALERSADLAGFQLFDRAHPSPDLADALVARHQHRPLEAHAGAVRALVQATKTERLSLVDAEGTDEHEHAELLGASQVTQLPASWIERSESGSDAIVCLDLLDALPDDDVAWVLDELFSRARGFLYLAARASQPTRTPLWRSPAGTVRARRWWLRRLGGAATRHPELRWELALELCDAGGRPRIERHRGGPLARVQPPRVWLLDDPTSPVSARARQLVESLGWPCERIELAFRPGAEQLRRGAGDGAVNLLLGASTRELEPSRRARLRPPWPELVIGVGARAAPVVRWLRKQSARATHAVQLDDTGASPAACFDLVVTPVEAGALPHARRLELASADPTPGARGGEPGALAAWLARRGAARPHNDRGTTRPQLGFELLCSRLIENGVALPFPEVAPDREAAADWDGAIQRIRALLGA